MNNKKLQSRPRQPLKNNSGKVPLTYYRSSSGGEKEGSSPFVRNKPQTRLKSIIFGTLDIAIIMMLLAVFIYSLIVASVPSISASSYTYRTSDDYLAAAKEQLKPLSNRNKLSINEAQIIKSLQSLFPEIAGGNMELPVVSQTAKIHLIISEPAFALKSSGDKFIISSNGVVVGRTQDFARLKKLPVVEDQSDFKLKVGSPAFSAESAKFIESIVRTMDDANIDILSMVLPPVPMELNLRTTDRPYFIKFNLSGDASLQAGQFIAARHELDRNRLVPAEYIDVRVQGKIFYK